MSTNLEELESLLFDWESGSLEAQGVERIREILIIDADARQRFVQMQMITAAMQLETDAGLAPPSLDEVSSGSRSRQSLNDRATEPQSLATSAASRPKRRAFSTSFWLASALALLVCVLGGWIAFSQISGDSADPALLAGAGDPNERDASREATSHGIALITRLVDVAWEVGQPEFEVGDALPPGRFAILSGHAQVEFLCGATVVVEGPAELELESAALARVRSGRLRAHVPPAARGFSLEVDGMKVVDLGTEFGLSVTPEGANVQVFDGEVELHRPSDEKRLLSAGQAVVRTAGGLYQESQVTPESFVDIAGLESRVQRQRSARFQRWQAWSDEARLDSRLIAYYSFDNTGDWERRLACGNEPTNRELDGAIVGARQVAGRWESKQALEFKQPADRVRVQIPGEYRSLTLACWVKIDSLDRWYNSLFLTDGYDKGEPHWQILDTGQIYFSVRPVERTEQGGPRDFKALSPPFWRPSMNGKWLHLAVTCDVDAKTITHYTNGSVLSRHVVPEEQMPSATRIGAASIGNWAAPTLPDTEFAIRNLNGSLDELVIFAAALTADEIKEMYENGKP